MAWPSQDPPGRAPEMTDTVGRRQTTDSAGPLQAPPARLPDPAVSNGGGAVGRAAVGTDPAIRPARPLPVGSPNGSGIVGPQVPRPGRNERNRGDRGPRVVQGRRSRRVVRRIDVWTVLKLSFLFYLCMLLVLLVAGVVLWNIAASFNVIHSVEKFIRSLFDLQTFTLHPDVILEASVLGGVVLAVLATVTNVLVALLYNLISDIVGGVQVIVLEEARPPEQ